MEKHSYLIKMHAGRVEDILVDRDPWTIATSS